MSDDLDKEAPPAGQPGDAISAGTGDNPTTLSCPDCGGDPFVESDPDCDTCDGGKRFDEPPRRSRLLTVDALRKLPPPVWRIEGLIPEWGVGQLYGRPGSWKTFFALDLALSLCTAEEDIGEEWHGHRINRGGDAIYIAMEGGFDFRDRIDAWLAGHPSASADRFFALVEEDFQLGKQKSLDELVADVQDAGCTSPAIVVVDTQALATAGVDENSNSEMGIIMSNAKALAKALRCFVLLVHHTGWQAQGRSRGASAQLAALDLAMGVDAGTVVVSKVKAAPLPDPMRFTLTAAGRSAWAQPTDVRDRTHVRLLRLFVEAGDDGHTIADLETALSMSKTSVRRYVDRLLDDEMVAQVPGSAAGGGRGRQPDRYVWTHRLRFLANFLS